MADWSYCSSTPPIPSPTSKTSGGQQRQQQNYVSFAHDHHYPYESFGHPFPGLVGAEMIKLWSNTANESAAAGNRVLGGHDVNMNNKVETRSRNTLLSSKQVDASERSFQEEIEMEQQLGATLDEMKNKVKLEPERKMELSRELGLHSRQVAVWFKNRRRQTKEKENRTTIQRT